MLMRSSGSEHKHPEARHLCAPRQRQQQRATPGSALPALLPWLSSLPTYERALFSSDDSAALTPEMMTRQKS